MEPDCMVGCILAWDWYAW